VYWRITSQIHNTLYQMAYLQYNMLSLWGHVKIIDENRKFIKQKSIITFNLIYIFKELWTKHFKINKNIRREQYWKELETIMEFMTVWRSKRIMTKAKIRRNIPSLDYTKLINKELPLLYIQRTFKVLVNTYQINIKQIGYNHTPTLQMKIQSGKNL